MSLTFEVYCQEFFKSIVFCNDHPKMITDLTVRDALLDQYKFVHIRKIMAYHLIKNNKDNYFYFKKALPRDSDLLNALTPFGVTSFKLPEHHTRYEQITDEIFDNYICGNLMLPLSCRTARQVFEEIMVDKKFSTALVRIVAGFGDISDFLIIRRFIGGMCDGKFEVFIHRFPEFKDF